MNRTQAARSSPVTITMSGAVPPTRSLMRFSSRTLT